MIRRGGSLRALERASAREGTRAPSRDKARRTELAGVLRVHERCERVAHHLVACSSHHMFERGVSEGSVGKSGEWTGD